MTPPTDKDLDELEARARDLDANFKMAVLSELADAITTLREDKRQLKHIAITLADNDWNPMEHPYDGPETCLDFLREAARQALKGTHTMTDTVDTSSEADECRKVLGHLAEALDRDGVRWRGKPAANPIMDGCHMIRALAARCDELERRAGEVTRALADSLNAHAFDGLEDGDPITSGDKTAKDILEAALTGYLEMCARDHIGAYSGAQLGQDEVQIVRAWLARLEQKATRSAELERLAEAMATHISRMEDDGYEGEAFTNARQVADTYRTAYQRKGKGK